MFFLFISVRRVVFYTKILLKFFQLPGCFKIYFEEKNISKQESIVNEILNIEQNDVYAMIYLAFIRYQQFRFPEFQELLRNASSACDTDSYLQKYIDHFQELLNNL